MVRRRLCFIVFMCAIASVCLHAGVIVTDYNVENIRVQDFVHGFSYTSKEATRMKDYNISPPSRRDQPAAYSITWTRQSGTKSQRLIIGRVADYSDADTITISMLNTSYSLWNLVPKCTYYYKVESILTDGNVAECTSGVLSTTGQVRMIGASTIWNVRDLGGWPTASGYPILYEKIYRGAETNGTYVSTEADRKILHDVGIKVDLDLRTSDEAANIKSSPLGDDVEYGHINLAHYYYDGFKNYASRFKDQMTYIFKHVKAGNPIYFHCQIGADRTGNIAILLEGLLGVSESNIYKDYELTSFSGLNTHRYKDQIEDMIDLIKTMKGETLEEQFFTYFVEKIGMDPVEIMEFKSAMLGHDFVDGIALEQESVDLKRGETYQLNPIVTPERSKDSPLTYISSDTLVAKVDQQGKVTAVRGGVAVITVREYMVKVNITVNVETVESELPREISDGGKKYYVLTDNIIQNGSFEYGRPFLGWQSGLYTPADSVGFGILEGGATGERCLVSKIDDELDGNGSLRSQWPLEPGKTYVIGYKIKNTSGQEIVKSSNLKILLTNGADNYIQGRGDDFKWDTDAVASKILEDEGEVNPEVPDEIELPCPSYNGQWKDVVYVVENSDNYKFCELRFDHLSKGGDNTCLDNFYIAEVTTCRKADVNMDDKINATDVVSVYNYIIVGDKSKIYRLRADVNQDNGINAADVVAIYNSIITGK